MTTRSSRARLRRTGNAPYGSFTPRACLLTATATESSQSTRRVSARIILNGVLNERNVINAIEIYINMHPTVDNGRN